MIQENMLPAGLSLRLATPTLPAALDLSASFTLRAALDPSASSTLPAALDLSASSTLSTALDPSASSIMPAALDPSINPLLSVTLDPCSARPSNLSAGFGLRSTIWKSSIAALALFSSICSHGHGYSSLFQEKLLDVTHSTFSKAFDSYHCVNTLYDGMINSLSAKSILAGEKLVATYSIPT
jgi:hypothetical protein